MGAWIKVILGVLLLLAGFGLGFQEFFYLLGHGIKFLVAIALLLAGGYLVRSSARDMNGRAV